MLKVTVRELIDGSRAIDRMQTEIREITSLLIGLAKKYHIVNQLEIISRVSRNKNMTCIWEVKGTFYPYQHPQELSITAYLGSDDFTFSTNSPGRNMNPWQTLNLYVYLQEIIDVMIETFPEIEGSCCTFIAAQSAKENPALAGFSFALSILLLFPCPSSPPMLKLL